MYLPAVCLADAAAYNAGYTCGPVIHRCIISDRDHQVHPDHDAADHQRKMRTLAHLRLGRMARAFPRHHPDSLAWCRLPRASAVYAVAGRLALCFAAVILGILGMAEYTRPGSSYRQGIRQARWGLALSLLVGLMSFSSGGSAAVRLLKHNAAEPAIQPIGPPAPRRGAHIHGQELPIQKPRIAMGSTGRQDTQPACDAGDHAVQPHNLLRNRCGADRHGRQDVKPGACQYRASRHAKAPTPRLRLAPNRPKRSTVSPG